MNPNKSSKPNIIIDTREQLPYFASGFKNESGILLKCKRKKLDCGDYSIEGEESRFSIERKSKIDAYGTIGNGRERFVKELEKLSKLDYTAIIIESSLKNFMIQPLHSKLNPKSAIMSLISWSVKYNVHIWFAEDRSMGQAITRNLILKYIKHINNHPTTLL